jgi:hypothetical protein
MAAYLKLASALWVLPGEEGTPGGPGDAFYWLFLLVPVLVAFAAFNSVALFFVVRRVQTSSGKAALFIWFAVAGLWVATVAIDRHKSFRAIDAQYGSEASVERDA